MATGPPSRTGARLMLYAMYDASVPGSAPRVRIGMLAGVLSQQLHLVRADGGRWQRLRHLPRVIRRLRQVDAVYVESATAAAMPWDLLTLAIARAMGRPVGVYFRDAYQLYRHLYPVTGPRQRLSDAAWRVSMILLRWLATVRFAPSAGLAAALKLRDAVLLPPGTDPSAPDLGPGRAPLVAYVGAATAPLGFDLLRAAMELVRREAPDARLLVVSPAVPAETLPDWVDLRPATRDELPALLAPAAACVLPLPVNAYTNLARAVRLTDYLSWGKPIVATDTTETRALLEPTGAGLLVDDAPAAIAAGLLQVISDDELAARLARAARALAVAPGSRWQDRATLIVKQLVPAVGAR